MAEETRQKFKDAEAAKGPGGGPGAAGARGGFQKPKDTKKTVRRLPRSNGV